MDEVDDADHHGHSGDEAHQLESEDTWTCNCSGH